MSDRLKEKIGEELYNQIIAKGLKSSEFDLVDGWIPKDRFNEVSKELKITKEKVTTLEGQSAKFGELVKDNEDLKTKYGKLEETHKLELSNKDIEIGNIYKSTKFENALIKEGCKHPELLMNRVDLSKLTMENDNIIGLTDILKGLKTDYSDMFVTQQTNTTQPPKPSDPPKGNEGDINWEEALSKL